MGLGFRAKSIAMSFILLMFELDALESGHMVVEKFKSLSQKEGFWHAPKSQVSPKLGLNHSNCEISGLGAHSQLPTLKGVRGACWKLRDRLGRGTSLLNYTVLHPNPTNKLVRTHSAPFWCWDKPWVTLDSLDSPGLGLRGSHHLPPYSILYSSPSHLHPNGSFSRDSQSGVSKLFRFRLSGLWKLITPRPKLGSGWGLNQSCSFRR